MIHHENKIFSTSKLFDCIFSQVHSSGSIFVCLFFVFVCLYVPFVCVKINRSTNCIPVVSSYPVTGR